MRYHVNRRLTHAVYLSTFPVNKGWKLKLAPMKEQNSTYYVDKYLFRFLFLRLYSIWLSWIFHLLYRSFLRHFEISFTTYIQSKAFISKPAGYELRGLKLWKFCCCNQVEVRFSLFPGKYIWYVSFDLSYITFENKTAIYCLFMIKLLSYSSILLIKSLHLRDPPFCTVMIFWKIIKNSWAEIRFFITCYT